MKITLIIATLAALESAAPADVPTPETLFSEGQAAYDHTDYTTAITKWRAAYDASGEPSLLFDVAQAQRLSGDCASALKTYQHFIAIDPDPTSDQHAIANDLSRELASKCVTLEPPLPDPAPRLNLVDGLSPPKHQDARSGRALRIGGLAAGSAGAVTLAIGLGLGHHGQTLGDEVTRACAISCDWAAQEGKNSTGQRDVAIGRALDALGGAAIVGGAIAYYLGYREDGVAISPVSRESGAVVTWSGSW